MSDELAGGRWVNRRGVRVWIAAKPIPLSTVRERPKPPLFNTRLIACPCGATVVQGCRSASGAPVAEHAARKVSRRCVCGSPLDARKRYCDECRLEKRRENWRLSKLRSRAVDEGQEAS